MCRRSFRLTEEFCSSKITRDRRASTAQTQSIAELARPAIRKSFGLAGLSRCLGTALTYARRYALFTLVGLPRENDLDAPDVPQPQPPCREGRGQQRIRESMRRNVLSSPRSHLVRLINGRGHAPRAEPLMQSFLIGRPAGPPLSRDRRARVRGECNELGPPKARPAPPGCPHIPRRIVIDAVCPREALKAKAKPLKVLQRLRLCRARHSLRLRYKTGSLLGLWTLTSGPVGRWVLLGCEKPPRGPCKQN